MKLEELVFLFTKSLNPVNYHSLVSRRKRDTAQYFLLLLFVCIIAAFILNIPNIVTAPSDFEKELSKFEKFNITGVDVALREPVILLTKPKVVIDLEDNKTEMGDESVLITAKEILYKKPVPNLFKLQLYTIGSQPLSEYKDILGNINKIRKLYWIIYIFILPSLIFTIFVFDLIKYTIIIFIATILVYLISRVVKRKAGFMKLLKIGVYSSTIFLILDITLARLLDLGIFTVLIYFGMFIVCYYMATQESKHKKEDEDKN